MYLSQCERRRCMKKRESKTGLNEEMLGKLDLDDKLLEQINGGNSWQLPDNKVAYEDGKGQVRGYLKSKNNCKQQGGSIPPCCFIVHMKIVFTNGTQPVRFLL